MVAQKTRCLRAKRPQNLRGKLTTAAYIFGVLGSLVISGCIVFRYDESRCFSEKDVVAVRRCEEENKQIKETIEQYDEKRRMEKFEKDGVYQESQIRSCVGFESFHGSSVIGWGIMTCKTDDWVEVRFKVRCAINNGFEYLTEVRQKKFSWEYGGRKGQSNTDLHGAAMVTIQGLDDFDANKFHLSLENSDYQGRIDPASMVWKILQKFCAKKR